MNNLLLRFLATNTSDSDAIIVFIVFGIITAAVCFVLFKYLTDSIWFPFAGSFIAGLVNATISYFFEDVGTYILLGTGAITLLVLFIKGTKK